jgi:hypothetical protein
MRELALAFAMVFVGVGCDGDSPPVEDDDGPDCVGHEDCGTLGPEGGNIIFEYIYFDTQLQDVLLPNTDFETATRVMAYFLESHPESVLPMAGQCNNLETTDGWPLYVAPDAVEIDVGTVTITGVNTLDEPSTIPVPIQPAGTDQIGRPHDIFYQAVIPDAAEQQKPNSSYTVELGGAGDVVPTVMEDAIVLAGDFTVNDPDIEDDGPLVSGTDFPVAWTPGTTTGFPSDDLDVVGGEVLGVVWLVDVTGKPTHMCPVLHSSGAFTIPGSAIEEYRAVATARGVSPDSMILLRNAIIHRLEELPNGDDPPRRIDMLSVLCWAQLMNVEAPL